MPSELQYLTDQNVEAIGSALTQIQKMRLRAALQGLREEDE